YRIHSTTQYFYVLLAAFALVVTALYFANESRTGRAWRALREDPLAAETMTIPVNRLKLLAFAFGAGVAGFAGAIYGSVQTGAFPGDYDIGLLITIYAVVILGGTGSLAGVALGAIVITCAPELLPPLCLAAIAWENLLVAQTAGATRLILLGALLVALMNARPQGLLGTARVEIV